MKCETCRFWERYWVNDEGDIVGVCYRYPPVPLAVFDAVASKAAVRQEHAETTSWDWCGEWQADEDCDDVDEKAVKQRQKELKSELKRAVLKNWSAFKGKDDE